MGLWPVFADLLGVRTLKYSVITLHEALALPRVPSRHMLGYLTVCSKRSVVSSSVFQSLNFTSLFVLQLNLIGN
jgi:hypothetical protein